MKLGLLFLFAATVLAVEAIAQRGPYWLLLWPAISFGAVASAYLWFGSRVFGKGPDGTMAWPAVVVLLPYLLFAWSVWRLARLVVREDGCNEVSPGLFVGRRPLKGEIPSEVSLVVDLTAEFFERRDVIDGRPYICAPVLDNGVPEDGAFLQLVSQIANWPGAVYIHCAQGHGRSGTLAAAVLVAKGYSDGADDAVARLRAARPHLRLRKGQQIFVRRLCERILQDRQAPETGLPV